MPTFEEALHALGIDYADEAVTSNVTRALNAAKHYLYGSVGEDVERFMPDDPRVKELVLTYADDLYSNRGVTATGIGTKVSSATRLLVQGMELQLQLELRQLREAAREVEA